eukprot:6809933-Prorocentrum_lima.AAC.1
MSPFAPQVVGAKPSYRVWHGRVTGNRGRTVRAAASGERSRAGHRIAHVQRPAHLDRELSPYYLATLLPCCRVSTLYSGGAQQMLPKAT